VTQSKPPSFEEFNKAITVDHRPWGMFQRFPHESVSSIKIITLDPGGVLSLQYHKNRSEFWLVLDGGLEMTVGERVWRAEAGEQVWIPAGTRHRARCVGAAKARFFELWIGDSEEDDIVRIEDVYGR
jgi:mannose-6-phosphate isomerase-like protein (cupin superfamily)